jgi:hypothetical protein
VAKLNLNRYDLIIFLDNGEGDKIRKEIGLWPGILRREVNVIVVGDRTKTFDPNIEFILGVNSFISKEDINKIEDVLEEAINRHTEFLTPWQYVKKNEG